MTHDDRLIDRPKRVEVYWNLHKNLFSVRHKGKVIGHYHHLRLHDVTWVVQPAGNARVRRTRRKNVHAFARGKLINNHTSWHHLNQADFTQVFYDPYHYTTFVTRETHTPVLTSDYAMFNTTYNATHDYYGPRVAFL